MSSAGLCFKDWNLQRDGCSRLEGVVSHARCSAEVGGYVYMYIYFVQTHGLHQTLDERNPLDWEGELDLYVTFFPSDRSIGKASIWDKSCTQSRLLYLLLWIPWNPVGSHSFRWRPFVQAPLAHGRQRPMNGRCEQTPPLEVPLWEEPPEQASTIRSLR